jgi:hypothetical protein
MTALREILIFNPKLLYLEAQKSKRTYFPYIRFRIRFYLNHKLRRMIIHLKLLNCANLQLTTPAILIK